MIRFIVETRKRKQELENYICQNNSMVFITPITSFIYTYINIYIYIYILYISEQNFAEIVDIYNLTINLNQVEKEHSVN